MANGWVSSILLRFEGKRAPKCVQCLIGQWLPIFRCNFRVTLAWVDKIWTAGFAVVPYIRGIAEPIKRIWLNTMSKLPKNRIIKGRTPFIPSLAWTANTQISDKPTVRFGASKSSLSL